ncbi:MAG: general stress protein [Gemmatimonadaceae bacterium]
MPNTAAFGIYRTRDQVVRAVDELRSHGFRSEDISVLMPENVGTKDLAHEKNTKAPEGTATGAAAGAVIGGVFGWLVGVGALFIPGLGPFIAAGPLVAVLSGVGAGGVIGGLSGGLIGMGIPEFEAKRYEGLVKGGNILMSVHCDDGDWCERAKSILVTTGAEDIASTSETKGDYLNTERPAPRLEHR